MHVVRSEADVRWVEDLSAVGSPQCVVARYADTGGNLVEMLHAPSSLRLYSTDANGAWLWKRWGEGSNLQTMLH